MYDQSLEGSVPPPILGKVIDSRWNLSIFSKRLFYGGSIKISEFGVSGLVNIPPHWEDIHYP